MAGNWRKPRTVDCRVCRNTGMGRQQLVLRHLRELPDRRDRPHPVRHTRVPGPDTIVPQIGDNPHMSDLYYCRTRQVLLEAMADAANERFPEHALAALAAHGPVNAERWEYAIALVRLLNDDEYVPFLTSPCAHPVNAYLPGAEATVASQVTAWRNTLTTTGGADQDAGQGTRQAAA